ncbi:unnamed protein product [Ectocarpus fasciculatus]
MLAKHTITERNRTARWRVGASTWQCEIDKSPDILIFCLRSTSRKTILRCRFSAVSHTNPLWPLQHNIAFLSYTSNEQDTPFGGHMHRHPNHCANRENRKSKTVHEGIRLQRSAHLACFDPEVSLTPCASRSRQDLHVLLCLYHPFNVPPCRTLSIRWLILYSSNPTLIELGLVGYRQH